MDEDGTSLPSGRLSARVNTKRDLVSFEFNRSLFADDAAFIFLSRKGIEVGTAHINHAFRTFGLEVHLGTYHDADKKKERTTSKTEFMFIPANGEASPAEKADITVDGNRFVSYTDMFVYLGSRITHTLSDSTDLSARIGKGWGAFFKAKPVLLNKHISMDLRINLFKSLVLGQVLWGCESWALTGGDRDALDTTFLHQALRSMFNLRMRYVKTHRITNTDLRARANIPTLNSTKQVRTLHQLRKDTSRRLIVSPAESYPAKLFAYRDTSSSAAADQ